MCHAAVDVLLDDNGEEFDTLMVAGLIGTRVSDSGDTSLSESGTRDTVSPVAGWWMFTKRSGLSRHQEEMEKTMKMLALRRDVLKAKSNKDLAKSIMTFGATIDQSKNRALTKDSIVFLEHFADTMRALS